MYSAKNKHSPSTAVLEPLQKKTKDKGLRLEPQYTLELELPLNQSQQKY